MYARPLALSVTTALVGGVLAVLPAAPALADGTVTVGPQALRTGSTGIVVTKEGEVVSGVPGYRSPATGHFVEDAAAVTGSALQLWTGAAAGAPYAKYYVGKTYPASTVASTLTDFTYRTRNFTATDPAPYLNVEYYNASAPSGQRYLNLVWTPGAATGSWQEWGTSTGWKTTATFVTGLPANTAVSLATAGAAIAGDDNPLFLLRANVVWGDTGGGYNNKYALLGSLALTEGATTTYSFDAPTATCANPTGGAITGAALADPTKWTVRTEYQPNIPSTAFAKVAGLDPSLGQTSALQMSTGPGNVVGTRGFAGKVFVDRNLDGCTIGDLTALSFRTYALSSTVAPYLNIEVTTPTTPTAPGGAAILVWTPSGVVANTWQTQNPLTTGTWTVREGTINGRTNAYTYASWTEVQTELSSARIERGIQLVYGDSTYQPTPGTGYSNKTGYVDSLSIGTGAAPAVPATFANPATTEVVYPTDITGSSTWQVETDTTGTGGQVEGPGTPPAGTGSFEMRTGPGNVTGGRVRLKNTLFADKPLTDVTSLGYSFYRSSASDPATAVVRPALNIRVAFLNAGVPTETSLIYEPVYDSSVTLANDIWQSADAFSSTAKWWATSALPGVCGPSTPNPSCPDTFVPWSQVRDALAALGGATINYRGVTVVAGQGSFGNPWAGYIGAVDKIRVGGVSTDVTYDFEYGLGSCLIDEDFGNKVATLLADCTTSKTLWIKDGWTIDGGGYTITGTETPSTSFSGAILQNLGTSAYVKDLTIRTTADWANPAKNSGGSLSGIKFLDAAGSITDVKVTGISHGNGVQEGNAIDVTNTNGVDLSDFDSRTRRVVTLTNLDVSRYQKTGVRINGKVDVTLTNSRIDKAAGPTGASVDAFIAANSVQVSRGAIAVVSGNKITGNQWDGSADWSSTAVLLYNAGTTRVLHNVIDGDGTDVGIDAERDGNDISNGHIVVGCNAVARTSNSVGAFDIWNTGIYVDNVPNLSVTDNSITGFATPIDGTTNVTGQGGCNPNGPTASVSGITTTTANVSWTAGTALDYAPVDGWVLVAPDGTHDLPASTTTYALTGLDPNTAYSVSVRAKSVSGSSAPGNKSFTTVAGPSTATIATSKTTVVYGKSTTLSGSLLLGGVGAAGQTVTLERKAGSSWTAVATLTTDSNGKWTKSIRLTKKGTYRAKAAGFPTKSISVAVSSKVIARAKGSKVKVTAKPTLTGAKSTLQKKAGTKWMAVATKKLNSKSKATFIGLAKGKYRVVVAKKRSYSKGTSKAVRVT